MFLGMATGRGGAGDHPPHPRSPMTELPPVPVPIPIPDGEPTTTPTPAPYGDRVSPTPKIPGQNNNINISVSSKSNIKKIIKNLFFFIRKKSSSDLYIYI
ncbi:hypothetical protein CsSME_00052123 [Camellia sinensis var. sinensis]